MTEKDWLTGHNFHGRVLRKLARNQERKWRLYAAACCRRAIPWTDDEARMLPVVQAVEDEADGLIGGDVIRRVRRTLSAIKKELGPDYHGPKEALYWTVSALDHATEKKPSGALYAEETCRFAFRASYGGEQQQNGSDPLEVAAHQHWLLARCMFGNPFRPVAFAPGWRTSTAVGLADAMYTSRDFAGLPILADALEEAGCDHPDVLAHCRGDGPHVRGCWVVDLVLGKA